MKKSTFNRSLNFALFFAIAALIIFTLPTEEVHGVEAGGGPTISGVGAWGSSITMSGNVSPYLTEIAAWNSGGGSTDYLSFIDSGTAAYGAHLNVKINSVLFSYSGNGANNTDLVKATNVYVIAKAGTSPDKGRNDTTKTANVITADSCGSVQLTDISFNADFSSSLKSNSVKIGTSNKTVFQISTNCTTSTKINFEKVRVFYPQLTTSGSYSNTFVLTAVDGVP